MLKLYNETPDFLLPGHHVQFGHNFPDHVEDQTFVIKNTIQIPRRFHYIITEDDYVVFNFDDEDTEALEPDDRKTLYEILIAIEGKGILVYPVLPSNIYTLRMEEANVRPDPADTDYFRRYLGAWNENNTPKTAPKLLAHMVKDLEAPDFYIYNDAEDYAKAIIHMVINRCLLEPVEAHTAPVVRHIEHFTEWEW